MIHIKNLICLMTVVAALGSLFLPTPEAHAQGQCNIDIVKEATPSDGTAFGFTCTEGFSNDCDGNPTFTLVNGQAVEGIRFNPSGEFTSITVVEQVTDGWVLDEISCEVTEGGPNGISFDFNAVVNGVVANCIDESSDASCTFSNVRACDVTIGKEAASEDGTLFNFTAPGSSEPEFNLENGEEIDIQIIAGEDVDVTETLPLGWRLNDVECSNADGVVISNIDNGVNLACGSGGGSVECIFANTNIRNIPTMSEWGLIATALILGMVGFFVIFKRRKTS